jgi:hypothetical protein
MAVGLPREHFANTTRSRRRRGRQLLFVFVTAMLGRSELQRSGVKELR